MVTQDDRSFFKFQKQRLEQASRNEDSDQYHRIYNQMISYARKLVADQRWWEIWAKDEAFGIMRDILAIPPYLGLPTQHQVNEDLAVHKEIGKALKDQTESLERTKLVVQSIDNAATAAGIVIGVGSATVVARELVKRVGLREAGKLLAKEFGKNQIVQHSQDKMIDGLSEALGADPTTAHMALNLAQAVRDARRARLTHSADISKQASAMPRSELNALNAKITSLKQEEIRVQQALRQPAPRQAQIARRPNLRKSLQEALGGKLPPGQEHRHVIPWKYLREMSEAAVTDTNWKRIAERFDYDPGHFMDAQEFKRQWQIDMFNELNNVWRGSKDRHPRGGVEVEIDWGVWQEVRERVLRHAKGQ